MGQTIPGTPIDYRAMRILCKGRRGAELGPMLSHNRTRGGIKIG